jgi:RNA polymerase primary sigma factor
MVETINKYQQIQRQLIQDLGREPLPEEISAEMEEDIDKVRHIIKISQDTISLETSVGEDDEDSTLEDFIEDVKNVSPDRAAALELLRDYVREVISQLSPREQKILEMRFGLEDGVAHTLEEVGREFDVTRERIRQIEAKALEKIQKHDGIAKLKGIVASARYLLQLKRSFALLASLATVRRRRVLSASGKYGLSHNPWRK